MSVLKTILLVEDDATDRGEIRLILEHEGYTVLETDSAWKALDVAASRKPHVTLVICELYMQEMSGVDVVSEIAKLRLHIPVLIVSRSTSTFSHRRVFSTLKKPFSAADLIAKVHELIG